MTPSPSPARAFFSLLFALRIVSVSVSMIPAVFRIRCSCSGEMSHLDASVFSSSAQDPAPSVFLTSASPIFHALVITPSMPSVMDLRPFVMLSKLTLLFTSCMALVISRVFSVVVSSAAETLLICCSVSSISPLAFSISWYSFWYAVEDLSTPFLAIWSRAFWALSTTDFWASSFAFSSSVFLAI